MVVNIATGSHFSQIKLFLNTNKFFSSSKLSHLITSRNCGYTVHIGKKTIKFIISSQCDKKDFNKIKEYLETMFSGHSILIHTSEDTEWIEQLKKVKVFTLK